MLNVSKPALGWAPTRGILHTPIISSRPAVRALHSFFSFEFSFKPESARANSIKPHVKSRSSPRQWLNPQIKKGDSKKLYLVDVIISDGPRIQVLVYLAYPLFAP